MNAWLYRLGYALAALIIIGLEITAIIDPGKGDTITENIRFVIFTERITWIVSLAATLGFFYWFTTHMWWRKR